MSWNLIPASEQDNNPPVTYVATWKYTHNHGGLFGHRSEKSLTVEAYSASEAERLVKRIACDVLAKHSSHPGFQNHYLERYVHAVVTPASRLH